MRRTDTIMAVIFFILSGLLFGLNVWLRFFSLPLLDRDTHLQQAAFDAIRAEETAMLKPELKNLLEQYSEGVSAVDSVFHARDEVFTGALEEDQYQPVALLPLVEFFSQLRALLLKSTIISNLSLDHSGKIAFSVRTPSYEEAGKQMEAFHAPLLTQVEISSVSEQQITNTFDFVLQARVNPMYWKKNKEVGGRKWEVGS